MVELMPMVRVREIKYLLFLIRLWNHYPRKNEARYVDVSLLCVFMRLSGFNCILFTFYMCLRYLMNLYCYVIMVNYTTTYGLFGRFY